MTSTTASLTLRVGDELVSAIALTPREPRACLVLAHGAGAGMQHPFMAAVAAGLAARRIATLRYQFPFTEKGARRPDPPRVAQATVAAAVAAAATRYADLPLFAGGKSFGGRMTSQAQASGPMAGVRGLIFFGFPLHPDDQPDVTRAAHLKAVHVPMLFLQGSRDKLARLDLLQCVVAELPAATLVVVEQADHSFRVPKRSGLDDVAVLDQLLAAAAAWMAERNCG